MSDWDKGVKKGAVYSPSVRPPKGTIADEIRKKEERQARERSSWTPPVAPPPQSANGKKDGCFVATAAFGDYSAPEVLFLRAFRDTSLAPNSAGRAFIRAYYAVSPALAGVIERSPRRRAIVRTFFLRPIIATIRIHRRSAVR